MPTKPGRHPAARPPSPARARRRSRPLGPRAGAGNFAPHSEPDLCLRPPPQGFRNGPLLTEAAPALTAALALSMTAPDERVAAVIPPGDDRQSVAQPKLLPWCAHVRLLMTAPDGARLIGSGWLIGPRTIITAGHCVYERGWMKEILVTPAGDEADFPTVRAAYYTTTNAWINGATDEQRQKADLGMVSVADPIAGVPGPLPFVVYDDARLAALTREPNRISVAGFPANPYGAFLVDRGTLLDYNDPFLEYDVDTAAGQSGAPVLHWVGENSPVVIGVHHFNVRFGPPPINRAIRIGPEAAALLNNWANLRPPG